MLLLLSESMPVRSELDISGAAGDSTQLDGKIKQNRSDGIGPGRVWPAMLNSLMNSSIHLSRVILKA